VGAKQILATFVHISDIHIGDVDPGNGDAALDATAKNWWRRHPLFDGFLGHSYRALDHLTRLFIKLRRLSSAELIVTGDLTTTGHGSQFVLAKTFLEAHWALMPGSLLGCAAPGTFARSIPGNHDHWPGKRRILGGPTKALGAAFPSLPFVHKQPLAGGKTLVFTAINTDAQVRSVSVERLYARGSFASQLQKAQTKLGARQSNEIRVLLLHHSRTHARFALGIVPASRAALDAFIKDCGISIILSGHTHTPWAGVTSVTDGARQWDVLDARSGTTTQRDFAPPSWKLPAAEEARRFSKNTLLVHRLVAQPTHIDWEVFLYVRTDLGFRTLYRDPMCSVRVWPI
jgi:hypothetical protein